MASASVDLQGAGAAVAVRTPLLVVLPEKMRIMFCRAGDLGLDVRPRAIADADHGDGTAPRR